MEVKKALPADFIQLAAFNARVFPQKKIPATDYLNFWFGREESAIGECLILQEGNGEIFGQILASKMSYYYCQKTIDTVWLFDLIVDEHLRNNEYGIDLLLTCMYEHPDSCSTGSGPLALPIHLKMGNKLLGEIRKYIGIPNFGGIFTSIGRGIISEDHFPKQVDVEAYIFYKVSKERLPELNKPFNDHLFEIARDRSFLQWRYFSGLHSYAFYQLSGHNDFFVLRTTVLRGVTVMLLVDYRCNMEIPGSFEILFKAITKVMRKTHIGILIAGSSLRVVDDVLESHHFRSVGRARPVIGFVNTKSRVDDVKARKFAFITLADSDGETNWR